MATEGYLIVYRAAEFSARFQARAAAEGFQRDAAAFRDAVGFVDIRKYRGMGRDPLLPYPDPYVEGVLRRRGHDVDSNSAAAKRFRELLGDHGPLIPQLEVAQELFVLIDDRAAWELIGVSRKDLRLTPRTLGFDLGWWGEEFYSLISDCIVAPKWHGADPDRLSELAEQLRGLNAHVLFETPAAAQQFRSYYVQQDWAEDEDGDSPFVPIRIEEAPAARVADK
jgi:hypothetical protein